MDDNVDQNKKPLIVSITAFNDNTTFTYANGDQEVIPHKTDFDFGGFVPDPMMIGLFRHILHHQQEITGLKLQNTFLQQEIDNLKLILNKHGLS